MINSMNYTFDFLLFLNLQKGMRYILLTVAVESGLHIRQVDSSLRITHSPFMRVAGCEGHSNTPSLTPPGGV